jgi:hypothetical protein
VAFVCQAFFVRLACWPSLQRLPRAFVVLQYTTPTKVWLAGLLVLSCHGFPPIDQPKGFNC